MSGEHARLQMKEGSLVVTDLNSTNGTFIDDKRLSPGVPAMIQPGRYLTFGTVFLKWSLVFVFILGNYHCNIILHATWLIT